MSGEVLPAEGTAEAESPDQANPETMPLDQLAELVRRGEVLDEYAPAAEPVQPEEPAAAAEPEAPVTEEPAPSAVEEVPAVDLKDIQQRLEREQWQARYEKLEQHAGRLAGEIGHLKKQYSGNSGYETAESIPEDRATELSRRLDEHERRYNMEASNRAAADELASAGNRPELAPLKLQDEIAQAAQKHVDRWQEILKIEEPSHARAAARELASGILMDAIGLRLAKAPPAPARNESRVVEAKLAVSASGATAARVGVRPKAVDPNTMPLGDLRKIIEKMSEGE